MNERRLDQIHHRLLTRTGLPAWAEPLTTPARYLWVLYRRMQRDKAFLRAAGMGYATLVALVPLLMLLFGALEAVGVLQRNPAAIEALIFGTLLGDIPEVSAFLVPGLMAVDLGAMGLIGIGGLGLVAMRLYIQVENAYNDIFGFENDRPIHVRVLAFYAAMTALPVVVISTFLRTWEVSEGYGITGAGRIAVTLVQLGVLLAALKGFPAQRVPWRPAFAGAITSLVLLDLAALGFREYLVLFAADDPVRVIYGSVGVLPVFLLWLYLAWLMVLVGVEVAAVTMNYRSVFEAEYAEAYKELTARVVPGVESVLLVATQLAAWFLAGRGVMGRDDLIEATGMRAVDLTQVLRALEIGGLIVRAEDGWLLARPPDQIGLDTVVSAWRQRTTPHTSGEERVAGIRAALDAALVGSLADAAKGWGGTPSRSNPPEGERSHAAAR